MLHPPTLLKNKRTMPRKVFLSILGTSFYHKCAYTHGDFHSAPTRYIQEATLDLLGAHGWDSAHDKIFIFCTEASHTLNWDATLTTRLDYSKTEQPYVRLGKVLADKGYADPMLREILIPGGGDEEEQWNIFTTIYNCLETGDELYLDITHGFRSLPMLLLVLCNYAGFLKHTSIKSITYGNFEARNAKGEAPIIDLAPIALLQDWTFAAADFISNGNTATLKALCRQEVGKMFRKTSGKQGLAEKGTKIQDYVNRVNKLVENIRLCQGRYLTDRGNLERLHENEADIPTDILQPFQPVLEKITQSVSEFRPENDARNMWEAADWCYNKKMYQQAVTFLQEGIISYVCDSFEWDVQDISCRNTVSGFLNLLKHGKESDYKEWLEENPSPYKSVLDGHKRLFEDYATPYSDLSQRRNAINHAFMNKNVASLSAVTKNIGEYIQRFKPLFFGDGTPAAATGPQAE